MKTKLYPKSCEARGWRMLPLMAWIVLGLIWLVPSQDLAAQPTIYTQPRSVSVSVGADATLFVIAGSSGGALRFQWYLNDAEVPGATTNALSFSNIQVSQAGPCYVIVSDNAGSTQSDTATVQVDTTFTKITTGPVVEDNEPSTSGTWADYDNDGLLDLFVANNGWSTGHHNSLYRNLGGDEFVRVTNALTLRWQASWGGIWGDYDNDGDLDIFVIHPINGPNELFRNDGNGVFTPVSNAATTTAAFHTDASWVDHDGDGLVDLFVTTQSLGQPTSYSNDFFYHNLGNGQFEAWTSNEVGEAVSDQIDTYGPAWCDIDDDGDLDLYVGSYYRHNFLYRNDGGRLVQVTAGSLPGQRAMTVAIWGDFNNDGRFDLFTAGENSTNMLHLNQGKWVFEDATVASGLAQSGTVWGPTAGDFDNDGDLDLYVAYYSANDVLFVNRGDGTFERKDIGSPLIGGNMDNATFADYNNDGFLDLFKACGDLALATNLLYRNSLPQYGNTNHWLKLSLKGTVSNASAIGARVRVKATIGGTETWQVRQVSSGIYGNASAASVVHFGLGDATNVEILRIEWPSGSETKRTNVTANQFLTMPETGVLVEPRTVDTAPGSNVILRAFVGGVGSPLYQWKLNGTNLPGATSTSLLLNNIQVTDSGTYTLEVSDGTRSYLSNPCRVTVYDKPVIIRQPQSLTVIEGSDATFTVTAISATPLRYQWRFSSTALADKTNSTLSVTNVHAGDIGLYDVVVSDSLGSITSQVATLTVLLPPSVTQIVTNYTVVRGGSVTLSVETSGALPVGYRWRRNNSTMTNLVLSPHQSFLVLSNVQPSIAGSSNRYWVILTNVAHVTPGMVSPNIYLTVLPDSDGDGMDDPWEARYPTASDPEGDADGDGQKNKAEYQAGTDPTDANSCLKFERITVSSDARIEFRAASNTTYRVEYAERSIGTGPSGNQYVGGPVLMSADKVWDGATDEPPVTVWRKLAEVAASPESRTVVVTDPGGAPQRYYRLVTPAQP